MPMKRSGMILSIETGGWPRNRLGINDTLSIIHYMCMYAMPPTRITLWIMWGAIAKNACVCCLRRASRCGLHVGRSPGTRPCSAASTCHTHAPSIYTQSTHRHTHTHRAALDILPHNHHPLHPTVPQTCMYVRTPLHAHECWQLASAPVRGAHAPSWHVRTRASCGSPTIVQVCQYAWQLASAAASAPV